jgi:hypothetical protein
MSSISLISLPIDILEIISNYLFDYTKCNLRLTAKEFYLSINFMEIKIQRMNNEFTYLFNKVAYYDMRKVCKNLNDWTMYFSITEYCANNNCFKHGSLNEAYSIQHQFGNSIFDKNRIYNHRKNPALGTLYFYYKTNNPKNLQKIKHHLPYCMQCVDELNILDKDEYLYFLDSDL